jgi:O-antigen ligase
MRQTAAAIPPPRSSGPSAVQRVGLYCFATFIFAAYANDLSLHIAGAKANLAWPAGILMALAFVACGTAFRGLKTTAGKAWLGMMVCVLFSTAFSIWKSESVGLLESYIPKSLFLFFYCCAFTVTLRQCRFLIVANIVCTSAILLSVGLFGQVVDGRLCIPDSFFMGGGNDLALALVSSLGFTLYLLLQRSIVAQLLGAAEFLLSLYYLLKTGSRGGFLALSAFLLIWLFFSAQRWKLVAMLAPALALVVFLPGSTLNRLVEIAVPGDLKGSTAVGEAQLSQIERTMLLEKSIEFAWTHPLFGVGPGMFTEALYRADVANRTHTHALGTHNTYTQVAAECGLPALVCYLVVLLSSIGSNYRIMKRTRGAPGGERVFTSALALFGSLIAFGVATIFHHDAYALTLPVLSGLSAALALASRNGDMNWILSETAAGNV